MTDSHPSYDHEHSFSSIAQLSQFTKSSLVQHPHDPKQVANLSVAETAVPTMIPTSNTRSAVSD